LTVLSAAYGRVAQWRRRAYARHPRWRRRLASPVISIGNVALGGSGKTPLVEAIAGLLAAAGHRPAIVSRGYGRRNAAAGALVISDGERLLVTDARLSGDEPQMLARRLPGIPIIVAADRYVGGRLAEARLGATCILLDDGFQHLRLARDLDLVIVAPDDLDDRVLPAGRLREPLSSASLADAVIVPGDSHGAARVGAATGAGVVFRLETHGGDPSAVAPHGAPIGVPARAILGLAGIARPRRFLDGLRTAGWEVRGEIVHRDHHWYTAADVARVEAAARRAGAAMIVTTEKDAVRLEGLVAASSLPWAYLPMRVTVEPQDDFRRWLLDRVAGAAR
jgi:tetraacyldisaccharide 4'-kinase